jgi:Integrase zinc binding domain
MLRRGVISLYHDHVTAGHPRISKTLSALTRDYWWPDMKRFTANYVKGCAICQATKSNTMRPRIPPFPITTQKTALPFETVAMDLIVDLPKSEGYNSILTITDHDCTKAAIFLPCQMTIDGLGLAALYAQHIFPHYGLPKKVISDRDMHLTSDFTRELCRLLEVTQNISTAYHPQIDGQSERSNQWLEQYLCIYGNFQQNDWAQYLLLAQYIHNAWPSSTTGMTPFELLMGFMPRIHGVSKQTNLPELTKCGEHLKQIREQAQSAIQRAQQLTMKYCERKKGQCHFRPFQEGNQVWLENMNLRLSHPTAKLGVRHSGPFKIIKVISPVAYRLDLPPHWRIFNTFHVSLLTPYKEMEEHRENFPEPPPDLINDKPEYEVEEVLASRRHGWWKKLQYLL